MDLSLVLIFISVFFLSFYILRRKRNLPPGPFRLPFVGSLFFLNELRKVRPHHLLSEAAKRYGNVMSFWIGPQLIVALNGYDAVHEALVKQADVFSGRPLNIRVLQRAFYEDGRKGRGVLLNDYGHTWRLMRRFTLQVLRDFGVGKTSIEDKVLTEIDAVSKRLVKLEGKSVSINMFLQNIISNVIYGIVFGRRYEYEDPEFKELADITKAAVSGEGAFDVGNFLPQFLVRIINKKGTERQNSVVKAFRDMRQYVLEQIDNHEATFDKNSIRDFIDLYLKTIQDGSAKDKEGLEKEEMFRVIMDLFIAGSETTSTSLDWAILYISEHPDVQRKCQKEITELVLTFSLLIATRIPYADGLGHDGTLRNSASQPNPSFLPPINSYYEVSSKMKVVKLEQTQMFLAGIWGQDHPICRQRKTCICRGNFARNPKDFNHIWQPRIPLCMYDDRKDLVLYEDVYRNPEMEVPVNVVHNTLNDTTLYGYNIPKDTLVIPSIYSTSYDPKYWNYPSEFRPERFVDGAGKLMKNKAMIPFSSGPRQCLGEPLARMELFLVFANFLQRFTFKPVDKSMKHTFESVMHQVTNSPKPYNVRVHKRN